VIESQWLNSGWPVWIPETRQRSTAVGLTASSASETRAAAGVATALEKGDGG
jgi:hypothetical protein